MPADLVVENLDLGQSAEAVVENYQLRSTAEDLIEVHQYATRQRALSPAG